MLSKRMKVKIENKYGSKQRPSLKVFTLFNPSQKFEETKFENFKNSSKLEGINIHYLEKHVTLDKILAAHRKVS